MKADLDKEAEDFANYIKDHNLSRESIRVLFKLRVLSIINQNK